jgi:hypothetical protein
VRVAFLLGDFAACEATTGTKPALLPLAIFRTLALAMQGRKREASAAYRSCAEPFRKSISTIMQRASRSLRLRPGACMKKPSADLEPSKGLSSAKRQCSSAEIEDEQKPRVPDVNRPAKTVGRNNCENARLAVSEGTPAMSWDQHDLSRGDASPGIDLCASAMRASG